MNSAWMNGQHQHAGPASQAANQLTFDTMKNRKAGSANNLCHYRAVNMGVEPPQSGNVTFRDGTNRQMSNWHTSVAPHQTASFPQPSGGNNNNYFKFVQNSTTSIQPGNPCLPINNGFQVATQPRFHHNSAANSVSQSSPVTMNSNTSYPQQDMSPYWNHPVYGKQSLRAQDGNVSDLQHYRVQNTVHQNVTKEAMRPISVHSTAATSVLHEQPACSSSLVSATAHNRRTVHNQNPRLNSIQRSRFSSSFPPGFSAAVIQSLRNNSNVANPLSSAQIFQVSGTSPKTQQYAPQLSTVRCTEGEAASAVKSNSYSRRCDIQHFQSKVKEKPLNFAAEIARIADSLQKSYSPAASDHHHQLYSSSNCRGKQFASEVRLTESNQTTQPVASTVAQTFNSSTTQLLPLRSGQSLPKTSVTAGAQHIVNTPSRESSVAHGVYHTAPGDGSGSGNKSDSAFLNRNLDRSSSDASQLMQMLENISPQKNKTQFFVANSHEMLEKLESSVKPNDCSIHLSPGCTGTRAVAVVLPLSQESYQVASKPNSSNTSDHLGEADTSCISSAEAENKNSTNLREGFNVYTENVNQTRSNNCLIKHSAGSSDGMIVSSSSSSEPQDLLQKQMCAGDLGSELANMQADQGVAAAVQQQKSVTSEVPVNQDRDKEESKIPTEQNVSSIPTTTWTKDMLTDLILEVEKAQIEVEDLPNTSFVEKLLDVFWDGNLSLLVSKLKKNWYKDLITDIREFSHKHVTTDSIVLSQVKDCFGKVLQNHHVLKEKEVYSEPLYKSSWLNVNEHIDDIDKEFGFPWCLKHRLNTFERGSQPDQDGARNCVPAQTVSEVPNELLLKTGREAVQVGSGEEKQASTPVTTSSNETESTDSDDPYYSFEIEVLPPEQAKIIFEQVQNKVTWSMDVDSHPEEVTKSSVEELHDVTDVPLRKSKLENESASSIEQLCCISKWMEIIVGSDMPSLSKCQCKKEESHKDCTDKILDKEETAAHKIDKLCSIKSPRKELSQNDALTEDDNNPHLYFDKGQNNISQLSINDSQSSIIIISENEDEEIKSAGSSPSRHSDGGREEIKTVFTSEVASQMSDPEADRDLAELTDVTDSSLEPQEENKISKTPALQTTFKPGGKCETVETKPKTLSSNDRVFPSLKKSKQSKLSDLYSQPVFKSVKYKKDFVAASDSDSPATNVKTVELVLFGSSPQKKHVLSGSKKSPVSSPRPLSNAALMAPKVLSVNVSPLKRKANVPTGTYSVKQLIHEKWRKSFPPTKIKNNSKLKTFASVSGASLKKAETTVTTSTVEPPGSSEMKIRSKNTKLSLSLKRRRSLSYGVRIIENKRKTDPIKLTLRLDEGRSDADSGSCAATSFHENNVLKFSVLPNNFNFQYGSNGRKETVDPVSDMSDLVEEQDEDKNPSKTATSARGTWYPSEKKYCPLPSSPVPKTPTLFQEFQKKYMENTQSFMDK